MLGTDGPESLTGTRGRGHDLRPRGQRRDHGRRRARPDSRRAGNDRLDGGSGNDAIAGAAPGRRPHGRDGNDAVDGGLGNDIIDGGSGAESRRRRFHPRGAGQRHRPRRVRRGRSTRLRQRQRAQAPATTASWPGRATTSSRAQRAPMAGRKRPHPRRTGRGPARRRRRRHDPRRGRITSPAAELLDVPATRTTIRGTAALYWRRPRRRHHRGGRPRHRISGVRGGTRRASTPRMTQQHRSAPLTSDRCARSGSDPKYVQSCRSRSSASGAGGEATATATSHGDAERSWSR